MAKLIDGKAIAKALRASVTEQATRLSEAGVVPGLAVILVGDDPASEIYVRNKERAASKAGVNAQTIRYDAETAEETLLAIILSSFGYLKKGLENLLVLLFTNMKIILCCKCGTIGISVKKIKRSTQIYSYV